MAGTLTSIRLDTRLADEAAKALGVTKPTEAVHVALREIVALRRSKKLMGKRAGELSFSNGNESRRLRYLSFHPQLSPQVTDAHRNCNRRCNPQTEIEFSVA